MNYRFKNKYTERELAIIALCTLKHSVSVTEMIEVVSRVSKTKVTRQSVVGQIRLMASKLASDGYVMRRTSKLGRGAVGVFTLAKIGGK